MRTAAKADDNQTEIVAALRAAGLVVTLPWPPSGLNPNKRQHWSALSKAKAAYRLACATVARQQGATKLDAKALTLHLTFHPPDRRPRDIDNMLSSMKSGLDGLADVLGVDDRAWSLVIDRAPEIGGFVRVAVTDAESAIRAARAIAS